jgi:anti-sigma28 factor (negative regulator of flagellin synthesis)
MIFQVFTKTCAFHQPPRHGGRVTQRQPMTRAWSEDRGHASGTGRRSQRRSRLLASTRQARADKIAQLRHAVESGVYCVSAEQIAEKMVPEALVDMFT